MRLVIAEKPIVGRILAPFLRKKWPNDEIIIIYTLGITSIKFQYPKGMRHSDYPLLSEPKFKNVDNWGVIPTTDNAIFCKGARIDMDGNPIATEYTQEDLPVLMGNAQFIVCAVDVDPRGFYSFYLYLRQFCPQRMTEEHPAIFMGGGFSDECVRGYLNNMTTTSDHRILSNLSMAHVKRYFDYNFNVNALAVLRIPFRKAFGPYMDVQMSKYELQCLHYISTLPDTMSKNHELIIGMDKWKGTGKYSDDREQFPDGCLGSPASRNAIVRNLRDLGAIRVSDHDATIALTESGAYFLSLLHPDTKDMDLPFRIHLWQLEGVEVAKPKIDRYIKTFFGKQKRFNGNI
jgi:hypothetical protein